MAIVRIAAVVALFVTVGATQVGAQSLDPKEKETKKLRDGFAIGVSLGTALLSGQRDLSAVTGFGPGFRLWFGTSAGPNLLWTLNLGTAAYVVEDRVSPTEFKTTVNNSSRLSLGAQYYVRQRFWMRGAFGFAGFVKRDGQVESISKSGLGLTAAGGLDIYRRGIFVIDIELAIAASFFKGANTQSGSLLLGANWY